MELITHFLPKNCKIYDSGDFHLGPINHSRKTLIALRDRILSEKDSYLVTKGDAIDCVLPNDKRFHFCSTDLSNKKFTPQHHADEIIKILYPIKDRILVWLIGNHEWKIINVFNVSEYICDKLDVPFGGVATKLILRDEKTKRLMLKMFLTHGCGRMPKGAKDPIQRQANQKAWLKRKLEETGHTDCIYMSMGHNHHLMVVEPTAHSEVVLTDNGTNINYYPRKKSKQNIDRIPPEDRFYGSSGSMLKLYSQPGSKAISYGEMAMYGPTEIGWLVATLEDGQLEKVERQTFENGDIVTLKN